jgi:uncharacterized membrane protein YfcA
MIALLPLIGVLAGILTTVAGLGGGMILVLGLSVVWGPAAALASTAPALLIGNLHRLYLFRASVNRATAAAYACGALPGSIVGGLLTVAMPEQALSWLMVGMTVFAVTRALKGDSPRPGATPQWHPGAAIIAPAGFGIGSLAATAGGAGMLAGPLLMATGLTGEAYIATGAAAAASMHVGRLIAYGAGGLISKEIVLYGGILAGAILVGNVIGRRMRQRFTHTVTTRIEIVALVGCVTLAIVGIGR